MRDSDRAGIFFANRLSSARARDEMRVTLRHRRAEISRRALPKIVVAERRRCLRCGTCASFKIRLRVHRRGDPVAGELPCAPKCMRVWRAGANAPVMASLAARGINRDGRAGVASRRATREWRRKPSATIGNHEERCLTSRDDVILARRMPDNGTGRSSTPHLKQASRAL